MSGPPKRLLRSRAVGVVVPVHNERELLAPALRAIEKSFAATASWLLERALVIVLDSCDDGSSQVAHEFTSRLKFSRPEIQTRVVVCPARNVGVARALGCAELFNMWTTIDAAEIWIATTDADSRVPEEWLSAQIRAHEEGADLWTGRIAVEDWTSYDADTRKTWTSMYDAEAFPIHGASLGFNALAYSEVGGFPRLATGEDRQLCGLLFECGARWTQDTSVRVTTSARRVARAPRGFSFALEKIDAAMASVVGGLHEGGVTREVNRPLREVPSAPTTAELAVGAT